MTKELPRIITPSEFHGRAKRQIEKNKHLALTAAILHINENGVYPKLYIEIPKQRNVDGSYFYPLNDEEVADEVSTILTLRCKNAGWYLHGCVFCPHKRYDEELGQRYFDLELR